MIGSIIAGVWKKQTMHTKVADSWKAVESGWVKVAGVWRRFYSAIAGVVDLQARWALIGSVNDYAGTRDGTADGGATFTTVAGKSCINLGGGKHATLPEVTLGTSPWSFSMWYHPRSFTSYTHLLTSSIIQGTFTLKLTNTTNPGTPYIHTSVSGSRMGSAAIPLNQWSMLTFTYDGTTVRIYINKVKVMEEVIVLNIATTGLLIGKGAGTEYSDGYQRETLYFDRALSITEIEKVYDKLV